MTKVAPLVTLQHLSGEPRYPTWTSRSQPHGAYPSAKRECLPGISTQPSGLVIHPTHHWLAASPDDLVTDPALSDPLGIVEYKTIVSLEIPHLYIDSATQDKTFCLTCNDGSLSLKHTHAHYYQVQVVMLCTQRKWCDFVAHTFTDLHIKRLQWDPSLLLVFCNASAPGVLLHGHSPWACQPSPAIFLAQGCGSLEEGDRESVM